MIFPFTNMEGHIRQFFKLPNEDQSQMRAASRQLYLSARVYHCILNLMPTPGIPGGIGRDRIHASA
jgi:hypothetical protein